MLDAAALNEDYQRLLKRMVKTGSFGCFFGDNLVSSLKKMHQDQIIPPPFFPSMSRSVFPTKVETSVQSLANDGLKAIAGHQKNERGKTCFNF